MFKCFKLDIICCFIKGFNVFWSVLKINLFKVLFFLIIFFFLKIFSVVFAYAYVKVFFV